MAGGIKISELAKLCGVPSQNLNDLIKRHAAHFPKPVAADARGNQLYDKEATLKYLVGLDTRSRVRDGAEKALAELRRGKPKKAAGKPRAAQKAGPPGAEPRPAAATAPEMPAEAPSGEGMDVTAYRRLVEGMRSVVQYQMSLMDGSAPSVRCLGEAFDVLGRAEKTLLKLAQEYRALLPVDEVKLLVSRAYGNVRRQMLMMPQKLAHELEGLTPGQIQRRLDEEIREVLNGLSENPLGDGGDSAGGPASPA